MITLKLSETAVDEIMEALDYSTKAWMRGMPKGTGLPFSHDVKMNIAKQINAKTE